MTPSFAKEGKIAFPITGVDKPCHTWYKVVGDLKSNAIPLITLHGGQGVCYEYLLPLTDVTDNYGIPIVLYDQIGNGKSTRLREKAGDEAFWTEELFRAELDNLIDHLGLRERTFDLYGQSWGGMLAAKYAALQLKGLRKLVLADVCASVELREVLDRCEQDGTVESEEYEQACGVFYKRHLCRLDPWPKEVEQALGHLKEDPTVYGPSELVATGNLKDWSATDVIHKINVSTLLINGRYDECLDLAVMPYFERVKKVKRNTLENPATWDTLRRETGVRRFWEAFISVTTFTFEVSYSLGVQDDSSGILVFLLPVFAYPATNSLLDARKQWAGTRSGKQ